VNRLLIIRHGESEWNLEHRWQGWHDAPLTARGEQQARERAELLAGAGFRPAVVHCSDLGRAYATAEIVAGTLGTATRPHPGLRERNGGEWEGHTSDEIDERWPGGRAAWRRGEISAPPGGEEDDVVVARVNAALAHVLAGPDPAMIVTHHGVLRLIATRAGADISALIPNLGGYWFTVHGATLTDPEPLPDLNSTASVPTTD
jgi:broad specificity phosphatase PhoE